MPSRQRFFVELKDEETTVVSWKKLVSDAEGKLGSAKLPDAPAGANPALEARIAPEVRCQPSFIDVVIRTVLKLLQVVCDPFV